MPDIVPTSEPVLLEYMFQCYPDPVLVCDETGQLLMRNQAAEAMGPYLNELLTAHASWFLALNERARANGSANSALELRRTDGVRHICARALAMGQRCIVFLRDVTKAQALAEELRHLQCVDSLGYLTANLAHDLNNVLTAGLYTSTLLMRSLMQGDEAWSLAAETRGIVERAANLTREVLAFARREPAQVERVNVASAIRDLRPLIARVLGRQIELVFALDQVPSEARVNRTQFECVLLNLAANARDAMPNGGRLVIRCEAAMPENVPAAAEREWVIITVTDTGSGISPEVRERVFEPFFTTKPAGGGTGLGLAAAKRFVTQSGGQISVTEGPGGGTSFTIRLPRATTQPHDESDRPRSSGRIRLQSACFEVH